MHEAFKKVLLCLGLFALCVHFALVTIFARPFAEEKKKIDYYAEWYVYPYFAQNWNLFAPPPTSNYKLFVEYEYVWTQKAEVIGEILRKHQSNRLEGEGAILLAFINSIHYFEKNTLLKERLNGPVTNDNNFRMLQTSVINYLQSTRHHSISEIRMYLLVNDTDTGTSRVYFN